ncbi:MAG TPA: ester cyclase [Gemmatimonadaceae bacterium]|nr:ester cyclase [Gemmatimonadaceae bacterium]
MSAQDNARLARTVYEAYNDRRFDDAAAVVTDDFELRNMGTGETFTGQDGVKRYMQAWATAFPDSAVEIRSVTADDQRAVVEFIGRGTHTGPLTSPMGTIPATNRRVEIHFCEVDTIRGGRIASSNSYFDVATMLRQLGVTPQEQMQPAGMPASPTA